MSELTEQAYDQAIAETENRRARLLCLLTIVLLPMYSPLDFLVFRDSAWELVGMRLLSMSTTAITWLLLRRAKSYRDTTIIMAIGVTFVFCPIALSTQLTGGHRSYYHAGVMLSYLSVALMLSWPMRIAIPVYGLSLLTYVVPFAFEKNLSLEIAMLNTSMLVGAAFLSLIALRDRRRVARQEYEGRQALAETNAQLHQLSKTKDQLFQNISHEFRTPLALILAAQERIISDPHATTDIRDRTEGGRQSALRLLNLINDLLELAKLDGSQRKLDVQPVQVGMRVARLATEAATYASRLGLHFEVENGVPASVRYSLEPHHFDKIVLNLISNAFKFTPTGGVVVLRCAESASGLEVSVRDTGPGISAEGQRQLFERFRQLDGSSTRRHGGTGIGLALAKELVELMGGTISVQSTVGRGSTFSISFPATLRSSQTAYERGEETETAMGVWSSRAAMVSLGSARETSERRHFGTRGPRVLLCEDDVGLQQAIGEMLGERYQVTVASNGAQALAMLSAVKPHVIVTDFMMPEVDGVELCVAVRNMPTMRDTPLILMSARADLDSRVAGREAGADTYLTKPVERRELLASVEGLLRSRMRVIGNFLVHVRIGGGGQSEVFLGEHVTTGELAAVKLLSGDSSLNEEVRARLKREVEVLSKLKHPNIVRVVETGVESGRQYLATEMVRGATVKAILRDWSRLTLWNAREIAAALADALAAVHAAGVIHRDVKAENAMIASGNAPLRERVRLIDFGVVHLGAEQTLSTGGHVVGTLPYLSPELFEGENVSVASDVYALGVTMFEMVTGKRPYITDNPHALPDQFRRGVTPPSKSVEGVSPELDAVIVKSLATLPSNRWQSMEALATALRAIELTPTPPPTVMEDAGVANIVKGVAGKVSASDATSTLDHVTPLAGAARVPSEGDQR